ncbi:MAG: ArsI/CadI family heavy metal resistance metalloenzyme [Phenylobacterium sp.]|uniref:ArsI/CadI family heavy metal resistance metalloenzyme n=1 Tax=Phenylobacterium sp. TaxID=1871053 RepID=UPI0027159B64|nr:ArsI/CadI family heavy metal resistance metalloenzyme [Phenylobacterium sp.]MDO8901159.1 ArsI/CadI family heavy metal resistance metalloenzyme [Phenylobacterium sp.]MDP2214357.1 ArsI/CadI family heavy metal resistance metalloenzyme [Phenylobacterium sp.]
MKRLHVHVSVEDLDRSVGFYATLFGAPPSVLKDDYAKWLIDDPRVNFAISTHGNGAHGVDHLGIQVDEAAELTELAGRLKAAGETTFDQEAASCCYARSDKAWVSDPAGLRWETFHTFGEAITYGEDAVPAAASPAPAEAACCGAPAKVEPAPACC